MSELVVYKFGGTSLDGAERIARALELASAATQHDSALVFVASAIGHTTDTLQQLAATAATGSREADELLAEVAEHHRTLARALCGEAGMDDCVAAIDALEQELEGQVAALRLLGFAPPRAVAAILAAGERLATELVAASASERGLRNRLLDVRPLIRTDASHLAATVDPKATAGLLAAGARPAQGEIVVTQGFLGTTEDDITTTLGRGGSDYTATLIGAALGAREVVIWTDVDAVMTCDPRIVPEARPLRQLTYRAAAELAYFGARVLHPQTILPAVEAGIPVRVRNPLAASGPGTLIGADADLRGPAAIAFKRGITVVNVTSSRMLDAYGFLRRIFATFEAHRTSVDLVTTSEVSVSMTIDDPHALGAIVADLAQVGAVSVTEEQCIVSMVGDGLLEEGNVLGQAAAALDGAPVTLLALGASDVNLSLVVPERAADDTVRALHQALFGSEQPLTKEAS